jgi:3-phenylpropionate/trans-cinnamate dioxygenase ferredoxin component
LIEETTTVSGPVRRIKIAEPNEIGDGTSKIINVAGRSVAVFRIQNQYFAIANACVHRGGPLGEGHVENYEVTCPWHGWRFNLVNGAFSMIPTLKVKTFQVKENDEGVFIEV